LGGYVRVKLILGAVAAIFVLMAYFFISHAYVFLRLTTVLGFAVFLAVIIFLVLYIGTRRL
jgi:hypothetical protein